MMDLSTATHADLQKALEPISIHTSSPSATFSNWAKTFRCRPARVFAPTTSLQCRQILELGRREGARIHPVGVGHSPSDLACTNGWLVRMEGLTGLISMNEKSSTATLYSGTILHDVHKLLEQLQTPMALRNIGSISDQTIGGLISTASHGSGVTFPVLSQHVKSLVMALPHAGAPVVRVSRTEDPELFTASLCGLGATGLILEVEIEVEPAYRLREIKTPLPVDQVLGHLDEIKGSAEHVRVWWYPDGKGMVVARANRTYEPAQPVVSYMAHLLGYHVTQFFLFCSRILPSLTPLVGRWAWWLSNVDSEVVNDGHKVLNFDCLFPQYALEWAIPSENTEECLSEMKVWLDKEAADPKGLRAHFPIEIRWSCADEIWLSPSQGKETCWIGLVTFRPYGLAVPYKKLHTKFADILIKYGGRPHWAKEHELRPKEIEALYPEFDKFRNVLERVDPEGIMRSEYVRRHIDGETDIGPREFKVFGKSL